MLAGVEKIKVVSPAQVWLQDSATYFTRPARIVQDYTRINLRPDLVAGLTVAVVMLPQAIAYALIAELPPETGLYAAIVAAIVGALWGSSSHLHTGPTNAASLLVLSTLLPLAMPGTPDYLAAAGLLAVMVGVIRLVMGLARLGVLVNFVSDSVIIGFTAGAGILISVNQLRHLFRLDFPSTPSFIDTLLAVSTNIHTAHWISAAIGLGTILLMAHLKRIAPQVPGALTAIVLSALLVAIFGLDAQGVSVLGEFPRSLPPLTALPLTDWSLIADMASGAAAIAAIGLVEAISIARSIAAQSGERLDSNQEFVGQGLSNVAAGFLSGYTCSGSFTRSAVNFTSGARSAMASVFSGIFVLIAMLVFAPYAAYIPRAALAGVLVVTAYGMVDRKEMRRIWHASRGDSAIMIATLAATLLLPLQFAVLSGIIVSVIRFLVKTSTPQVHPVVPDHDFQHFIKAETRPVCPQVAVISVSGSLYFGATQHVETVIRNNLEKNPEQRYLLMRMHLVDHCDVSGIHSLESLLRMVRQRGGDVYMDGVRQPVMETMQSAGFDHVLGRTHFLERGESISYIFHRVMEPSICIYECPVRVFAECQALPKWEYGARLPEAVALPEYDIPAWLPSDLKEHLPAAGVPMDIVLIDVREPKEYRQGHVPHARLMPMRTIPQKGAELPRDQNIVVVCRIGRRSRLAAGILKDMGYENVFNLQGGVLAWEAAGYPLAVE